MFKALAIVGVGLVIASRVSASPAVQVAVFAAFNVAAYLVIRGVGRKR